MKCKEKITKKARRKLRICPVAQRSRVHSGDKDVGVEMVILGGAS